MIHATDRQLPQQPVSVGSYSLPCTNKYVYMSKGPHQIPNKQMFAISKAFNYIVSNSRKKEEEKTHSDSHEKGLKCKSSKKIC